jgi:hypothetical protein
MAYYMEWSSPYDGVHRIDLNVGLTSDVRLGGPFVDEGGLELSPVGDLLFLGEAGSTGCNLYSVNPLVSPVTTVGKTTWEDGNGFGMPSGHVYLGPNGKHVYYADHQFDASNLGLVLGKALYVFAEDSAARFAVSEYGVLDAQLLTTLVPIPNQIEAAAFTSADTELWTYDISAGQITCTNVADLAADKKIGVREAAAGAIGDYTFAKLVADPIRPRLYGLDAKKQVVVSIDSQTGTPLRTVVVGSTPTDLEIDAAGTFIYTGHSDTYAIAQIDAASFTFVKLISSPQESFDIAVLSNNRIATNNEDQWTFPAIVDVASGAVLDQLHATTDPFEGALFATADGKALFIGESGGTGSNIIRYDVSGGKLTSVTSSYTAGGNGYSSPARSVVGTPDGTSIYYAGYCLDGTNLTVQRYAQTDQIISVAPNGVLAISSTKVYRVADGTVLATLPSTCSVQAVSPDSRALYCAGASGITAFTLAGLQ